MGFSWGLPKRVFTVLNMALISRELAVTDRFVSPGVVNQWCHRVVSPVVCYLAIKGISDSRGLVKY